MYWPREEFLHFGSNDISDQIILCCGGCALHCRLFTVTPVSPCVCVLVIQSHPTLCDHLNCSPPGPLSMEFSRQEYWNGLPFPSLGDLLNPAIELGDANSNLLPFTSHDNQKCLRTLPHGGQACSSSAAAVAAMSLQSVQPHRRQPTRLPRPWDSPGKITGVGREPLSRVMCKI